MGFLDGLLDSALNATNWLATNSGNIGGVLNTVANVAGLVAGAVEYDSPLDSLLDYRENFNKASKYLIQTASADQKGTVEDSEYDMVGTQTNTDTLCGVWMQPTTLTPTGLPSLGMYQDVANALGAMNVPPTFVSKEGSTEDTALQISQAIFANAPISVSSPPKPGDPSPVTQAGFELGNKDGSLQIAGTHAYYAIPLGRSGTDTAWHGALRVSTTTTQGFRDAYKKEVASYTIFNAEVRNTALPSVWLVTLQVLWASAPYAVQLVPIFLDLWNKNYGAYTITLNTLTGSLEVLKVQAPAGVSPAQVRQAVSNTAASSISQTSLPIIMNRASSNVVQLIQPPDITVTDSTLV